MIKNICYFIVVAFLFADNSISEEKNLELNDLVKLALERNPKLKSYNALVSAQDFKILTAKILPDPLLEFGLKNADYTKFTLGDEDMSAISLSIAQTFPFPGKLKIKEEIEKNRSKQNSERLAREKLSIIKQVKELYARLFYYTKSLEIFSKKKDYLNMGLKLAETKYSSGSGNQSDIFKANLEISKIEEMSILMQKMIDETKTNIISILDYPKEISIKADKEIDFYKLDYTLPNLTKIALESSPILKESQYMISESNNEIKFSKKEFYPDIMLRAGNDYRGTMASAYEVMIGFEIPIFFKQKQSNMVKEAVAKHGAAKDNYISMKNEQIYELNDAFLTSKSSEKLVTLYKDKIIPEAKLSMESSLASYQYDKVDFLMVLSDIDTVYSYEMDYYKELSNLWSSVAKIEEITALTIIN